MRPSYVKTITPWIKVDIIRYSFPFLLVTWKHSINWLEAWLVKLSLVIHISHRESQTVSFGHSWHAKVKPSSIVSTVSYKRKAIFWDVQVKVILGSQYASGQVSWTEIRSNCYFLEIKDVLLWIFCFREVLRYFFIRRLWNTLWIHISNLNLYL